jgi:hypothetical protein
VFIFELLNLNRIENEIIQLYSINYKSIIVFKKGVYYQALRLQKKKLFQLI